MQYAGVRRSWSSTSNERYAARYDGRTNFLAAGRCGFEARDDLCNARIAMVLHENHRARDIGTRARSVRWRLKVIMNSVTQSIRATPALGSVLLPNCKMLFFACLLFFFVFLRVSSPCTLKSVYNVGT